MADVEVGETVIPNESEDSRTHSRQSSVYSDWWHDSEEERNKENTQTNGFRSRQNSTCSNDSKSSEKLILCDGGKLVEESRTDTSGLVNQGFQSSGSGSGSNGYVNVSRPQIPDIPPRQPTGGGTGTARHRALKSGNIVTSIPEVEISIPNNGNLAAFSADDMATFLRYLRLEDRLINHLHRNGLDGRRFGRLKDSDLDNLQMNNPVVVFFRDRTAPAVTTKKARPRLPFVL